MPMNIGTEVWGVGLWCWNRPGDKFMLTCFPEKYRPAHPPPQEPSPDCFYWEIFWCSVQLNLTKLNGGASNTAMPQPIAIAHITLSVIFFSQICLGHLIPVCRGRTFSWRGWVAVQMPPKVPIFSKDVQRVAGCKDQVILLFLKLTAASQLRMQREYRKAWPVTSCTLCSDK